GWGRHARDGSARVSRPGPSKLDSQLGSPCPRGVTGDACRRRARRSRGRVRALRSDGPARAANARLVIRNAMPRRRLRLSILLVLAFLFFAGPSLITFYTDWLWFNEVGYRQVFTAMLTAQTTLFTIVFATAALWLTVNLRLALASVGDFRPNLTTREGLEIALPGRQQLRTAALA